MPQKRRQEDSGFFRNNQTTLESGPSVACETPLLVCETLSGGPPRDPLEATPVSGLTLHNFSRKDYAKLPQGRFRILQKQSTSTRNRPQVRLVRHLLWFVRPPPRITQRAVGGHPFVRIHIAHLQQKRSPKNAPRKTRRAPTPAIPSPPLGFVGARWERVLGWGANNNHTPMTPRGRP